MKKTAFVFSLIFVACFLSEFFLSSCSKKNSDKMEITVLAAASLTDVCGRIKTSYEKRNPNVNVLFSFGGSGALQAQIEEGVPCDVFISAAKKQMNALLEKDLVDKDSVYDLLKNRLVLIVPKNDKDKAVSDKGGAAVSSFYDLALPEVKLVAVGEIKSVPAGQYAKTVCESLGIWETVQAKANYASDVRTALVWVEEGVCDAGIVYASDAAFSEKVSVAASSPEGSCPPVIYPVGIVKSCKNKGVAKSFVDFLYSDESAAIFRDACFVPLEKENN